MIYLSLNDAAKETGKSKATIHKAIKEGRLSVADREGNSFKLDPAEVFRVFPKTFTKQKDEQSRTDKNEPNTLENALMAQKIAFLEAQIEEMKRQTSDLKEQREEARLREEKLLEVVQRQTHLLAAPKTETAPEPEKKQRRWWSFL